MKVTLKHTTQGYVLIVDERPEGEEWFLDLTSNDYKDEILECISENNWDSWWRIIASETPLEGVKGIALNVDDTLITDKALIHDLLKEVSFEEVQATEHEDYYLITL